MREPVDDGSVDRTHEKVERQKKVHPPMCGERYIERYVEGGPEQSGTPTAGKLIELAPNWNTLYEFIFKFKFAIINFCVDDLGAPHHLEEVLVVFWGMWIFLSIRISVVQSVHYTVGVRA